MVEARCTTVSASVEEDMERDWQWDGVVLSLYDCTD